MQGRLRGDDALGLRFGLTVTKRVGHATERNRIKRRLRAAVAERRRPVMRDRDLDVVVIGRRDILTADYRGLIDDLRRALAVVTKPKARPKAAPEARPHSSSTDGERRGTSHA